MVGLTLKTVSKSFGSVKTIHDVDLAINDGEFVVFVGPSGSGKSTLLRMIAGLETVTSGQIEIGGRDVTNVEPAERGTAMVFQNYALYPHMSVRRNLGFALGMNGLNKSEVSAKVDPVAHMLQLDSLMDRKPAQLSGGQRQRVAIGRALVRSPVVFLFDEPLSNLDAELRVQMRVEIAQLHQKIGTTMIYVTHDQVEAMTLAERIVVLRDGKIEQVGKPLELFDNPNNLFVAGFIGSPRINLIETKILAVDGRSLTLGLPSGGLLVWQATGELPDTGGKLTIGIRPEHVTRTDTAGETTMKVDYAEHLGGVSYVYGNLPDGTRMILESRLDRNAASGDTLELSLPAEHLLVFTSSGQRLR